MKRSVVVKAAILICTLLFTCTFVYAQEVVIIDGREFVYQEGTWFENYLGDQYEVFPTSITVKLKAGVPPEELEDFNNSHGITAYHENAFGYVYLDFPSSIDPIALVQAYINSGLVELAEPSVTGKYLDLPNDPGFLSGNQWYLTQTQIPNAWNIERGNSSITVAVIDVGVDWMHSDIGLGADNYQNVWLNDPENDWTDPNNPASGNGVDNDGNGTSRHTYIDDWKGWRYRSTCPSDFESNDSRGSGGGHGTRIAGIIAAKTNNSVGIAGMAGGWSTPGVRIMCLSLGEDEFGCLIDHQNLADAIVYAAAKGAKVIQLSLRIPSSSLVRSALDLAHTTYGCFVACASGNNNGSVLFPANYPLVVAVGATNENDFRCSPSDWGTGQGSSYGSALDLAAPGNNIYSIEWGGGYYTDRGTSYAAPQVSALSALIWCASPSLLSTQVETIIKTTADKVGGYNYNWDATRPGHSRELGYGRINAFRALSLANGVPSRPQNVTLSSNNGQYGNVRVSWAANPEPDVVSYEVSRSISEYGGAWVVIATAVTGVYYVDPEYLYAPPGGDFHLSYKVRARDAAPQYSDYSDVASVRAEQYGKKAAFNSITEFSLKQNYPNPFNPHTTLSYSVAEDGFVSLKVFDVLGREVAALVNENKSAGRYRADFDVSNLPSGFYIYRLQQNGNTQQRKMLSLK